MLDEHIFSSYPGLLCTGDKQSDKGTLDDMGGKTVFVVFVSFTFVLNMVYIFLNCVCVASPTCSSGME